LQVDDDKEEPRGKKKIQQHIMLPSIVPGLKARTLALAFVKSNPKVAAFLDHPAGPFTSK